MAEVEERLKSLSSRAQAKLGVQASKAAQDALKQRLASVATELALEWIVGERRFESQGEQAEYWLARLFEEIFVDERPEARSIYDRFGFSLPRAQYLARLLRPPARRIGVPPPVSRSSAPWRGSKQRRRPPQRRMPPEPSDLISASPAVATRNSLCGTTSSQPK